MAGCGQLKPGFLMRVLSQGQMDLFDLGFARLVGLELPRFRHTFYDRGVRMVALACHGAGIDRSVFATVFNLSRQAHGMTRNLRHRPTKVSAGRAGLPAAKQRMRWTGCALHGHPIRRCAVNAGLFGMFA